MIEKQNIDRAARRLIQRYGSDARTQAVMRGRATLVRGDIDELMAWLAIARAIDRLQSKRLDKLRRTPQQLKRRRTA
jgi:hypothetical protein